MTLVPPTPPNYSKPADIIGWAAVSFILLALGYIGTRLTRLGARNPEGTEAVPTQTVEVPTASGTTATHRVSGDTDPGSLAALRDMAASILSMQSRLADQAAQLSAQQAQITAERSYSEALDAHIEDMIAGHAQGIYPPWVPKPNRTT